jgi:cytochrome c
MRILAAGAVLLALGIWGAGSAAPEPQPASLLAGDAKRGAEIYDSSCAGCHSLDANRIGPAHRGVVGRAAGSAPAYNYSPALKMSGVTWTPENLHKWLTDPRGFIRGAKMGFRLNDPQQRADVIAFLAAEGGKTADAK